MAKAQFDYTDNTLLEAYGGVSKASSVSRESISIDSSRTIRAAFNRSDYDYYRELERIPTTVEKSIEVCNKIYSNTPFIRSIIDMMADFTIQGIRVEHRTASIQNFIDRWMEQVDFISVSERVMNTLYRLGNAPVYTTYGKIKPSHIKKWSKADLIYQDLAVVKRRIPMRYTVLFPTEFDVLKDEVALDGSDRYGLRVNTEMRMNWADVKTKLLKLNIDPRYIQEAANGKRDIIPIPEEALTVLFYKKDAWLKWASPMIHAVIDPIFMLNKMKLCDKKAVDGLLSQVRLWNLGDYDRGIYPTPASIAKIHNMLASVGTGDKMDIVWGTELTFKESESNGWNYLNSNKYGHIMTEIYAGLGVPPGLTGNENNGSASDNKVSMKTLIERLEYGRRILIMFWQKELRKLYKAFNWKHKPVVSFDYKVLSDEHVERKLLIDMWDRNIISDEKMRQLSSQDHKLEELRVRMDMKKREKGKIPAKASPYHNPNGELEIEKIQLTADLAMKQAEQNKDNQATLKKDTGGDGRPQGVKDQYQRQRTSKAFLDLYDWANQAQADIAKMLNPIVLQRFNKNKLPELTKAELITYEGVKATVLGNLTPYQKLELTSLDMETINSEYMSTVASMTTDDMSIVEKRKAQAAAYATTHMKE